MNLIRRLRESELLWERRRKKAKANHAKWKTRSAELERRVHKLQAPGLVDIAEKLELAEHEFKLALAKRVHYWRAFRHADDMVEKRSKAIARERRKGATRISKRGLEFLTREEGVRRYAYEDSESYATAFVGHLIQPKHKGILASDKRKYGTPSNPKPMSLALETLDHDLALFEDAINRIIDKPMRQREFDAMVSLCFNIGIGGFEMSTVAREFNAGHKRAAANAILMWDHPAVLQPRRERERALFLTGRYS